MDTLRPLKIYIRDHPKRRSILVAAFLAIIIVLWALIAPWHLGRANKNHEIPAIPVVLSVVQELDVPVTLSALGSVTPLDTITLRTQINGQLLQVLFQEGQMVKTGDLLAEIDPRPFEAQLIQFEGQLARDQALLENAQLDLDRYQALWKQDSVSKQILDTQIALVKQYEGTVKLDQGQVASTKLNLSYCKIISPINGRVGLRLVDPGNYVQSTDPNGLVVLNNIHPMNVVFTVAEDYLPKMINQINTGIILVAKVFDRSQDNLLAIGHVIAYDNQIDASTGTLKLKAQYENLDNKLFPNQFVNVVLQIDTLYNATVIPTAAVQHGSKGDFVYLKNPNNTVSVKPVSVKVTYDDRVAITGDVLPNQLVVVEGADKLTEGAKVVDSSKSIRDPSK